MRPTGRTLRWLLLALIAPTASLIVWSGGRRDGDPLVFHLPVAGMALAAWLAFQIADDAEVTLSASPTSLVHRRALRTAIALIVVSVIWVGLCVQASTEAKTIALSAMFFAAIATSAAAAAIGERLIGPNHGGPCAIAALFFVFVLVPAMLRIHWTLDPVTDSWSHLYGRWLFICLIGGIAFFTACLDPARRRG